MATHKKHKTSSNLPTLNKHESDIICAMNKKEERGVLMAKSLEQIMRYYESIQSQCLMSSLPVIIRVDGKCFSKFTKNFQKPFDPAMAHAMIATATALAQQIPGTKIAYTQSDEVSLVLMLTDDQEPYHSYRIEKLCSTAASIATLAFNRALGWYASEIVFTEETARYQQAYDAAYTKGALFDARAFSIPDDDVLNYLIWRQNDCTRNSINAAARTVATPSKLTGLSTNDMQELLFQNKINWNDYPDQFKRGTFITKQKRILWSEYLKDLIERNVWLPVECPPILSKNPELVLRIMEDNKN